MKETKKKNEYD